MAVKNIMLRVHTDKILDVFGVAVNPSISSQPFNGETFTGAINRAKEVMKIKNIDLAIGIEAGLFKFPFLSNNYLDMHWCAILDKMKKITIGCSSGFELPSKVVHQVKKCGKEVGKAMDEFVGIDDIGRKMGAIGILSKGILDRTGLTEQAVLMAMIPRINERGFFQRIEE